MAMRGHDLLDAVGHLKNVMIAVATGGPQINAVNAEYMKRWSSVDAELRSRRIANPNPH